MKLYETLNFTIPMQMTQGGQRMINNMFFKPTSQREREAKESERWKSKAVDAEFQDIEPKTTD